MSSPSKTKGATFERDVVAYLREHGYPQADRKKAGAAADRGDVSDVPNWTLELKNQRTLSLGAWLDEAELEANHADTDWCAAVVKRKGTSDPGKAFAVMSLAQLVRLIAALDRR